MVKRQPVDIVPRIPILMHYAADYISASYAEFAADYRVMTESKLKLADDFGIDIVDVMSDPYRETTAFGGRIEYRPDTTPKMATPRCDCPSCSKKAAQPGIKCSGCAAIFVADYMRNPELKCPKCGKNNL